MKYQKGEKMRDNFDPMTMVPQNDDEALVALQRNSTLVTSTLRGIYKSYRGQEFTVLEAFEKTLLAHVDSFTK